MSAKLSESLPFAFTPLVLLATGSTSVAQSGSIQVALPSDIPMPLASRIDLLSQQFGIETEVAATLTHIDPLTGTRSSSVLFYSVTPGSYVVGQRIDLKLTIRPDSSALDGDRLVLRTDVLGERLLLERVGGTWQVTGTFGEAQPLAAWAHEQGMALSGDRAVIVNDTRRTIDVYHFPPVGLPTLSARIPLPVGKVAPLGSLALNGDRVVTLVRDPGAFNGGEELHVYELGPQGWVGAWSTDLASEFMPGAAIGGVVRASHDRIAVAIPRADTNRHPCGVVLVYAGDGAGGYVLEQRVEPVEPCLLAANIGSTFGAELVFEHDRMLVTNGYGATIHRVERGAQGWAHTGRFAGTYGRCIAAFAGSGAVGFSANESTDLRLEVYRPAGSSAGFQIVCPSPRQGTFAAAWSLIAGESRSMSSPTSHMVLLVPSSNAGRPYMLLIGRERASRVLGAGAELCIGGAGFRRVLGVEAPPTVPGAPVAAVFDFSPADFGGAGDTLFFQAWRAEPLVGAGSTSNAIAITYAP